MFSAGVIRGVLCHRSFAVYPPVGFSARCRVDDAAGAPADSRSREQHTHGGRFQRILVFISPPRPWQLKTRSFDARLRSIMRVKGLEDALDCEGRIQRAALSFSSFRPVGSAYLSPRSLLPASDPLEDNPATSTAVPHQSSSVIVRKTLDSSGIPVLLYVKKTRKQPEICRHARGMNQSSPS